MIELIKKSISLSGRQHSTSTFKINNKTNKTNEIYEITYTESTNSVLLNIFPLKQPLCDNFDKIIKYKMDTEFLFMFILLSTDTYRCVFFLMKHCIYVNIIFQMFVKKMYQTFAVKKYLLRIRNR